ncbi:lytic transglycosylase domain-containing protein [Qipengyuania proteolytica]|uniref:lytic transglycosylase domain-containing protein n=1 Tax=Qipengyuania proteolytica TaxID=2867239 RepID=UPI001FFD820C|nr:lytic transglycosylase domain-containing protein [Qipengyuania proteolytica]
MILARLALGMGLACTALIAFPVKADVMEIDGDGARWVAGGGTALSAAPAGPAEFEPVGELPAEIFVPDVAVAYPDAPGAAIPVTYQAKVAELSTRYDLAPALIEALVWQESRWRHGAVSPVGARGLAQLMPGTARDLGVNPDDPFANLEGGARYLREQLDRFDGDLEKALAAYNAGPGRVERAGGIPRIRETQLYVAAIMGRLSDHSRE